MNSKSKQCNRKTISSWQIEKMQSIISDRWSEVWEIAQARDLEQKNLEDFVNRSRSNCNS